MDNKLVLILWARAEPPLDKISKSIPDLAQGTEGDSPNLPYIGRALGGGASLCGCTVLSPSLPPSLPPSLTSLHQNKLNRSIYSWQHGRVKQPFL